VIHLRTCSKTEPFFSQLTQSDDKTKLVGDGPLGDAGWEALTSRLFLSENRVCSDHLRLLFSLGCKNHRTTTREVSRVGFAISYRQFSWGMFMAGISEMSEEQYSEEIPRPPSLMIGSDAYSRRNPLLKCVSLDRHFNVFVVNGFVYATKPGNNPPRLTVFKSPDFGTSWLPISNLPWTPENRPIFVSKTGFSQSQIFVFNIASSEKYEIWQSRENLRTFELVSRNLPFGEISAAHVDLHVKT